MPLSLSAVRTASSFIGVDLGGGKGKNTTAVARLRAIDDEHASVEVVEYGTGKEAPFYDDELLAYLRAHEGAIVAIDAPLTLPACLARAEDAAPSERERALDRWFRERAGPQVPAKKPKYTPYTQRATEVLLAEGVYEIIPRETLGQGMGPLTARGVYLRRALAPMFRLDENLIEVYPKATIIQLAGKQLAQRYKRSGTEGEARLAILNVIEPLRFGLSRDSWRQQCLDNDHKFDAVMCAYTAYLYSRDACIAPTPEQRVVADEGWIWIPQLRA